MRKDSKKRISQSTRLLSMYERLTNGEAIEKAAEAINFYTSVKTIQRDLQCIRNHVEFLGTNTYLVYDRSKKAYMLELNQPKWLENEEIFAILKVLIESRAFSQKEMNSMIDKLTNLARLKDQKFIKDMMANEKFLYTELKHKKALVSTLWTLATAIQSHQVIDMYYKLEKQPLAKKRTIKPVGILFSEYYFYLAAYPVDKDFDYPTIYRVDRITDFDITPVTFKVPYNDRFQEGEFRKLVQFMYTGELLNIRFKFTGPSPQAVLERLPTARVIETTSEYTIFEAQVYGKGIKMWLMSQETHVEVLAPQSLREDLRKSYYELSKRYEE